MKKWIHLLSVLILVPVLFTGCSGDNLDAKGGQGGYTMPNDDFNYDTLWKEVETFQKKGLPKSALETVEKIYNTAKKQNNPAEFIKAVIHKFHYLQQVEEDTFFKMHTQFKNELKQSQFPITPILHSMLAEQYWHYYQNNRYMFMKRTETPGETDENDIRTWDLRKIVQETVTHYQKSLENPDQAKKTKIDIYDKILYQGNTGRKYRPTLYDFLAHRAVDFFMDSESSLTQPVYRFSLNNADYFKNTRDFTKLEITTRDPLSFHYYALTGLQELIKFHLHDQNPEPLVDVDLKRLRFLYREAVVDNKEKIYEKALEEMMETYGDVPVTAEIYYELASLYDKLGSTYKPRVSPEEDQKDQYKWYKKKAHELCGEAVKKFPSSTGAQNCRALVNRIESGHLDITIENVAIPGQPFPALVKYRNIEKIYLKIVKTDREEIEAKNRMRQNDRLAFFLGKDPVEKWETALPGDGDYQTHSAEVKVTGLQPGEYVLAASNNPGFDFKEWGHATAYSFFNVSTISYVHRNRGKEGLEFYLMDRETGQPLAKAEAQMWLREYSRSARGYIQTEGPLFKTDGNGYFNIPWSNNRGNNFLLEFINGTDRLYVQNQFYLYRPHDPQRENTRTFFFTDRGIYRPGQPFHFKGIILQVDNIHGENSRILPGHSTTVILYDANHQNVGELRLTSNEFGTFSGTFQLPFGRLNGNWTVGDNYGRTSFSVEEYKRPKFQVLFDPLEASYKLDDTVTVKGRAAAYAGYNIDNAEVKYRVIRKVFYPYPWYSWYWCPPDSPEMEILNEVTNTDEKGEFRVTFRAVPDLSIPKKTLAAFNFTVYAEVTDINGENQRAAKTIPIGYTALKINMDVPYQLNKDKDKYTFNMTSSTLSGDFVPAAGEIAFYRLKETRRLFREKPWPTPDKFTMDKKTYYKTFPHDSFADEYDFRRWEKEKQVFSAAFDTSKTREFALAGLGKWKTGKYVMEMTSKDRYGEPVKETRYFTVYSMKSKQMPYAQLDWFTVPESLVEPGKEAVVLIGSSAKDVRVVYEIESRGEIIEKKFLTLEDEQKMIRIPIEEKYRGNIGLHFTFVKFNRLFNRSQTISVPWSDRDLAISFETFRDKLKPGEKEEWRLKIKSKSKGGKKIEAEMLATMYDASLDAFRPLQWGFGVFPHYYPRYTWLKNAYFGTVRSISVGNLQRQLLIAQKKYDRLNWFGFYWGQYGGRDMPMTQRFKFSEAAPPPGAVRQEAVADGEGFAARVEGREKAPAEKDELSGTLEEEVTVESEAGEAGPGGGVEDLSTVKARTNFQETAFFYPHLRTGEDGEIVIAFTVPEALTKWKMMGFAHTTDLKYGFVSNELVTQKELMVIPNAPRFFREGDTLELTAKITNLSDKELSGKVKLMLLDSATLEPVDARFKNTRPEKDFNALKGQSDRVAWTIDIPDDIDTVTYRIVARSGQFSDGEEKPVPILKNRILVTESLPLPVRAGQTKEFEFKKLIDSSASTTLKNHKLTLEFTSNPVWYAVQALPYLMEFPHECSEQIFNRYYANSIASFIVNSNPKIKSVFDIWQSAKGSDALLSNLEKNQELKGLLLEETPWVLNGQSETQRKKRIALLFDLNLMAGQMDRALQKLKEGQMPSGAWPWFHGMLENRYITQYIVCGFAHLDRLKVIDARKNPIVWEMLKEAVPYLDRTVRDDYAWLVKHDIELDKMNINYIHAHYLYARSYFRDIPMHDDVEKAFDYYKGQAETYWLRFNKYVQGMIALGLNRYGNRETPAAIAKSIKEHALYSEEMGMYWKESYGFSWFQLPIETHALLIEMFDEVSGDAESVDELKTWLLKQKQTQDWRTTKATAEACYALLLRGSEWIAESEPPEITMGKEKPVKIEPRKMDNVKVEAGTGYFKTSWTGGEVVPDMGHISVKNNNTVVAWGSLYWQYFENLDRITPEKTPLQLKKRLFVERPSDTGPVLRPLEKDKLKIGDRVKVRIELRVDRTMDYVHMKDMRASGFEPENVISQCKWQDGLCYYESTKDGSTHFFFGHLPKGVYVFEYPLRVSHAGDFSNGITTIQCMYAPEFSSHSEGVRVEVKH